MYARSIVSIVLLCLAIPVGAVDLAPYDVVAPPADIRGASLQIGHRSFQGDVTLDGQNTLGSRVDRRNASVRLGRSAQFGETPAYFYASLPYVALELGGDLDDKSVTGVDLEAGEGVGDLALAAAIWPYADREIGRFVGVAAYAVVPTGRYDASRTFGFNLNPGNNRFAGVVQAAFHQRLGKRFDWSLAADAMFFEDNDRFIGARFAPGTSEPAEPARLEVKPYFSYQMALAWRAHPAISLAVSLYADRGGASRVGGGDWSRSINRERYGLWALVALSPRTRINLSYKSTVDDRSDLQLQDNAQVRFVRFF
ncbi:putative secreted protein [Spiribacter salinus M19-40]|uniref:Putative secreted protein n=1 Tax=Spiribacter salinus M19-40 TaxID=1260251 RepID=R4V8E4_9GAMM|nr:transporter [Spiribacter salinus]AGM41235.1 putative secreted protein [Spiribacter salinus M19-40]